MSWIDALKKAAKEAKVPIEELLVLAPHNDPFWGPEMPSLRSAAEWAGKLYREWSEKTGLKTLHIRRFHYYLLSFPGLMRPTDPPSPYLNTDACWNYIVNAVKAARFLGVIPWDAIEDMKNERRQQAYYWRHETIQNKVDSLDAESIAENISDQFTLFNAQLVQPYRLEIWIEKATMNDVLEPIARRYGVDLVIGEGEVSATQVYLSMARAIQAGKPLRILYISDFDPKGRPMAVSVARKIEWFQRTHKQCAELDMKIHHLMLTHEQCIEYELPRTPVKTAKGTGTGAKAYETLTRKFEAKFGQGATELDALEGLHPGEMARIITEAIKPYYDEEAAEKIREANENLRQAVHDAVMENEDTLKELISNIDFSEAEDLYEEFEVPEPEKADVDETEWLYSSDRDYAEQLHRFKAFKRGD